MKTLIALALLVPSAALAKGSPSISIDDDGDGVWNAKDLCDGEDDTVDLDSNGVPDCSETFADDFGFDLLGGGSFWTTGGTSAMYGVLPIDSNGYSPSGAYQIYTPPGVYGGSLVSDCMAVSPSMPHVLLTKIRIRSYDPSPRATLYAYAFDSMADCQGSGSTGRRVVDEVIYSTGSAWDVWGDRFTTDSSAQAVQLYVFSTKGSTGQIGAQRVDLDSVLLHDTLGDSDDHEGEPGMD